MQSELTVNDQQMFLLSDEEWDTSLREETWNDLLLCSPRTRSMVDAMLKFTRSHSDVFLLALSKDGPFAKSWTVMNLFEARDEALRDLEQKRRA